MYVHSRQCYSGHAIPDLSVASYTMVYAHSGQSGQVNAAIQRHLSQISREFPWRMNVLRIAA